MAPRKCKECGAETSTKFDKCRHCNSKPQHIRFWSLLAIGVVLLVYAAGLSLFQKSSDELTSATNGAVINAPSVEAVQAETSSIYKIGEKLVSPYLEVTVRDYGFMEEVYTGNQFADLKAEAGNQYLVMEVTVRNIDKTSQWLTDGTLWLTSGGVADLV